MCGSACPSREELLAYQTGTLPEDRAGVMVDHLVACPACQETVRVLNEADTFVAGLRAPAPVSPYAAEPEFQRAMALALARAEAIAPPMDTSEPNEVAESGNAPVLPMELGEYRLVEKLGEGGMGAVYRAEHTRLKRQVAVKLLPKDSLQGSRAIARFSREMEAIGQLNHPNIVQAHDAREIAGNQVLAMEYVAGLDLGEMVNRVGPLAVTDACELIRQAACGLQYAHDRGLVHRDIKPSNLILSRDGQLKILDFGLARLRGGEPARAEVTAAGQVIGTADYMAPEQVSDSHDVDIRADIYSLGCTFYKLLAGHAPFSGPRYEKPVDKMLGHARDPVPPLREVRTEVSELLAAIVERMLAKEPAGRFGQPREVAEALGPLAKGANLRSLLQSAEQSAVAIAGQERSRASTDDFLSSGMTGTESDLRSGSKGIPVASSGPLLQESPGIPQSKPSVAATTNSAPDLKRHESGRFGRRVWVALATAAAAICLCGAIIVIATQRGTLEIKTFGGDVEVSVTKGGEEVTVIDTKTQERITLRPGSYDVKLANADSGLRLTPEKFTLRRGQTVVVEVSCTDTAKAGQEEVTKPGTKGPPPLAIAPFDAATAKKHQRAWADHLGVQVEMTNSIGMKFVLIPPGEFEMGSSPAELSRVVGKARAEATELPAIESNVQRLLAEGPQHAVRITRAFYLAIHEVTIGNFQRFVRDTGYMTDAERYGRGSGYDAITKDYRFQPTYCWKSTGFPQTDEHPVVNVTWNDATGFVAWLSDKEKKSYGLPSEAEWEYACRAGTTTRYWTGDTGESLAGAANVRDLAHEAAGFPLSGGLLSNDGYAFTAPAKSYRSNPFGLYDMHGNVFEFCADWYDPEYYRHSPSDDPSGPQPGAGNVVRGGNYDLAEYGRCACRGSVATGGCRCYVGFRVVLAVLPEVASQPRAR
jgi:serine/threonine protein kinase/formylglycine-generating enzyme required for sulfatase activity